jgi:hypothetical protein
MAIFENPNCPVQPQAGVYGWYARKDGREITIYVGESGKRKSLFPSSTLYRGVCQVQRSPFTSNSKKDLHSSLDTNFIVGTAIRYFENDHYSCVWKHICDDPKQERCCAQRENPILQSAASADIKAEFRVKKSQVGYWKAKKTQYGIAEAEDVIFSALEEAMRARGACGGGSAK